MSRDTVEIVGGGLDGLRRATGVARRGERVRYVEPALRAGGAYVTESFLTPFRFNLGQSLVLRDALPPLDLLEPDPLIAVGGAVLDRRSIALTPAETAFATLEASAIRDPGRRGTIAGLAVALGIDPAATGSGEGLARLCGHLDDLVAVAGGNGLVGAALADELLAAGGLVVEGDGPPTAPEPVPGLGLCRLFVGLRGPGPRPEAFFEAVGFEDDRSLRAALERLRAGELDTPVGFVVDTSHLEPEAPLDEQLSSVVWQGVLPGGSPGVTRAGYTAAVLEALGVEERDVVFRLLWLPDDTGEPLGPEAWGAPATA
jgi:hypothetical protein